MSLGFLTESALVPSKAKAIKVDAKSMVDLKAVVFQKDQERQRRLREALAADDDDGCGASRGKRALNLGKYAHLRGGKASRKRRGSSRDEDSDGGRSRGRNRGVEERDRRDAEALAQEAPDEDDERAWSKRSTEMLRKKARLYEQMTSGDRGEEALQASGEFLVDFEAKRAAAERHTALPDENTSESVEITDEFGRSRVVTTDSEAYAIFMRQQEALTPRTEASAPQGSSSDAAVEAERQESETQSSASGGSFVTSQWEKRLKASEKSALQEVHERATLAQSVARASSVSSAALDWKSRKQQRLERLRKQRQSTVEPATEAAKDEDSVASEQATNFLSQFSSLM